MSDNQQHPFPGVPPQPPVVPGQQPAAPGQSPLMNAGPAGAPSSPTPMPGAGFPAPGFPAPGLPGTGVPQPHRVESDLADGEWHRMHPLTPLMQGGLFLIVVIGIVVANMRDRLISLFVPQFRDYEDRYAGDPVDWILTNNLVLVALGGVLVVLALLMVAFYMSWRFHQFRISDSDVEVKQGVLMRKQRRAPLDRVQGVNLTRPFVARLIGLAKLEVVGAGADANVKLEYLRTADAEAVRADILGRASGLRRQRELRQSGQSVPQTRAQEFIQTVGGGITGIIDGAEAPVAEPASVVHIPIGRLIGSHLWSPTTLMLVVYIAVVVVGSIFGSEYVLFALLPAVFGVGLYWFRSLMKVLRYSIAPTPDGLRITFGLTTTITETIPPGRVHAVEVHQSLLWRPFGWYTIKINRLSGKSAESQQSDPFTTILPVGTRADVERVLMLLFDQLATTDVDRMLVDGLGKRPSSDPYVNTPTRAWWVHPLSWKRTGFVLTGEFLLLRRGALIRTLAMFPLARSQSIDVRQGPLARAARIGTLHVHVVPGQVSGVLSGVDRQQLMALFQSAQSRAIRAARSDRTHRWAESVR